MPNDSLSLVASPCIRNCCLDENDICMGCRRSLKEIMEWAASDDTEKQAILNRAAER